MRRITRVKLIDRILVDVCGWPESAIKREEHVESGFIDYTLTLQNRRHLVVEAKKEGIVFAFPETSSKALKLSGSILTDTRIADAIRQVRGYCDDSGSRYAIATNGYAWIIFRAIREDMPWREGHARVFPSLEYIEANFTEFWNLLSLDAVQKGSLDEEFGSSLRRSRKLFRVLDRLYNADLPLQRNRFHLQLYPIIQAIFEDIANQDPIEILQSCYVHAKSLKIVAYDLNAVITDAIPAFLKNDGAEQIYQGSDNAGTFGKEVSAALHRRSSGQMYLILGGIGSGKTTFIKRYQRDVGKETLTHRTIWFHLDFLEAPANPSDLEHFAWNRILEQIRDRYQNETFETRRNIKKAFTDKLQVAEQTMRAFAMRSGQFETEISPYLTSWQADTNDYVPRLLRVIANDRKIAVAIFIDNVDQLSPAYQAQVFILAERITRSIGSITVLALREESYYTATLQRPLTAYTNRKFHIASPQFRKMIASRIDFALQLLEKQVGPVDYVLRGGAISIDRIAIADFLRIIELSIFEKNHNISRFIEALCFGNMRLAFDMFTTFMTSGVTDVDKMLNIYRRSGSYSVGFHEFVKSIMLGERKYYKDAASSILNVFDCGADRNASHFTSLRIIRVLSQRRGESNREGQGFIDIGVLIEGFENIFDNREDVIRSLDRLIRHQLIECNTKSTDSIVGASHVRVTSAGWYYARFLINAFAYLDLVLQDTPLNEDSVVRSLRQHVYDVDNLADRDEVKLERMAVRFTRVREFLDYLRDEEDEEHIRFELQSEGGTWATKIVPPMRAQIEREIKWIERRLRENRETIIDDISLESIEEWEGDITFDAGDEDS